MDIKYRFLTCALLFFTGLFISSSIPMPQSMGCTENFGVDLVPITITTIGVMIMMGSAILFLEVLSDCHEVE